MTCGATAASSRSATTLIARPIPAPSIGGTPLRLGPQLVVLLSVLVLERGRSVPAGRLAAALWGDPVPDAATATLRSHVSHLRRALDPERGGRDSRPLRTVGSGAGADVTVPAAASLTGDRVDRARSALAELARAHLVNEHRPGRYTLHDLLRAYAVELAADAPGRTAARRRLFDHYLHTADRLLWPHRDAIVLDPPDSGVTVVTPQSDHAATGWFAAERPHLVAAVEAAAGTGFDRHAWQLAWCLTTFCNRQGHWNDVTVTQRTALRCAERIADPGDGRVGASRAVTRPQRAEPARGILGPS
ncbi:AfsR/SARP family transcriptional regulator [Micromonospora sp. NBC_00421]|uniref:AfsR/SARP family transcriptional regulator n=1 Tax=Micromonospora sp. NBC_00421 TaxID=2975976 RepID=UPI002E1F2C69